MKKWRSLLALLLAAALCVGMVGCGSSSEEDTETTEADEALSSADDGTVSPDDVIGNTYTYAEENEAYGFTTEWTLTFTSESDCTMFEPNDLMGDATYTASWTYADGVFTVTLLESDTGSFSLSSMFDDEYTCDYYVYSDGTFEPVGSSAGSDVDADDVIGNTYTYAEENEAYGFTTEWTLTFTSESDCTMFEPNDLMGDATYTASWTYADGVFTVTLLESDTGSFSLSSMFDDEYTCDYYVYSDGTFEPAGSTSSDAEDTDTEETASDADYANVAYASDSDSQVMDIYIPDNATGSDAVIIVVHGGGFKFGDQTMDIIQPVIEAALENGYVVASVDYRKSTEETFPGALADVKAAVRYLKANAETYGIDTDRIVIWGESAGAYLSLMTALTADVEDLNGDVTDNLEYSSSVTALVDFYGPVEFYTMDAEYEALGIEGTTYSEDSSFESAFLGQAIGLDEEFTYTTWWGTYIDQLASDFTLSAWIQAGTSDTSVPYTQSENFAAALAEVIGEENVSFSLIEGAEHEDDAFYTDENLAAVFEFLAGVLG